MNIGVIALGLGFMVGGMIDSNFKAFAAGLIFVVGGLF